MIKFDNRKLRCDYNELKLMQEYASDKDVPIEKAFEIRKEQQKKYELYIFKKKLQEVVEKRKKNDVDSN